MDKVSKDKPQVVADPGNLLDNYHPTIEKYVITNLQKDKIHITYSNGIKLTATYSMGISRSKGVFLITNHRLPFNKELKQEDIIDYINHHIGDEDIKKGMRTIYTENSYQPGNIVTYIFIPEEDLKLHQNVFSPTEKALVSYNNPNAIYPDEFEILPEPSTIKYVIVNTSRPNLEYFTKVGDIIKSIKAVKSTLVDGVHIYFTIGGIKKKLYYPLESINSCGIYLTRQEANTHGNLKETLELYRIKAEHDLLLATIDTKKKLLDLSVIKASHEHKMKMDLANDTAMLERKKTELQNSTLNKKAIGSVLDLGGTLLSLGTKLL